MTLVCALPLLTACGGGEQRAGVCSNEGGALSRSAFVFVQAPRSGERVSSGFRVTGCSSTFEATVNWRLRAMDGRALASGFTQGGGLEPGPFAFPVKYAVAQREVAHLEVVGARGSTEEGFPPPRDVVPLVLQP